jgi:hypothetical protein
MRIITERPDALTPSRRNHPPKMTMGKAANPVLFNRPPLPPSSLGLYEGEPNGDKQIYQPWTYEEAAYEHGRGIGEA